MGQLSLEQKLQRHKDFWEGKPQERPLISVRLGDVFFSTKFNANNELLKKGHVVTPDQINVDAYLSD